MGNCAPTASQWVGTLEDVTIALFGLDNAGKTCLMRSLAGDFHFDAVPTVGLSQETFLYNDIRLHVYDLGGESSFRNVWRSFFAEIWGFIYVVDASDPGRFQESSDALNEMLSHKMMRNKPFIVVANKQDKRGAVSASKIRKRFKLDKKIGVYDAIVTRPDGDVPHPGVAAGMTKLLDAILAHYQKISVSRHSNMEQQQIMDEAEFTARRARARRRVSSD
jgi:ADP-ribosylation factor-like protein 13B